jgi:hypothetical protein
MAKKNVTNHQQHFTDMDCGTGGFKTAVKQEQKAVGDKTEKLNIRIP